jgi:hypothetical protein
MRPLLGKKDVSEPMRTGKSPQRPIGEKPFAEVKIGSQMRFKLAQSAPFRAPRNAPFTVCVISE